MSKTGRAQRHYEKEYKEQAVKLAKEIGTEKTARELGVPKGHYGLIKAVREERLDAGPGGRTPLKKIYDAVNLDEAAFAKEEFHEKWNKKYPNIMKPWDHN